MYTQHMNVCVYRYIQIDTCIYPITYIQCMHTQGIIPSYFLHVDLNAIFYINNTKGYFLLKIKITIIK